MKRILVFLVSLLLVTAPGIFAQDTWTQKASLSNTPVNDYSYGCGIGNKAYVVPGPTPGSYFETAPKTDFFEYDPATDVWTKKANLPVNNVPYGLAVSINGKGYFGLTGGIWEYDPAIDTWTRKLTLPAGITTFLTAFSIGGKGYFSWGDGASSNQLWEYNPVTDAWVQKANFPGTTAPSVFDIHTGFTIGNKGYVAKNGDTDPSNKNDLWEYDPALNTWTQKASFGGKIIVSSNGFGIEGKGYIATAANVVPDLPYTEMHFLQFDPVSNTWTEKAMFPGQPRGYSVGLSVGNKGYIGFGVISYRTGAPAANDFWEYTPAPSVTPPLGQGTGLQGIYYNGTNLSGIPLLTRIDTTINFDFSYGNIPQVLSPAPGIVPEDKYSVRWTGQVQPLYSETYTFYTQSDDGIRLWVNGVQLVDDWMNQGVTEKSGTINLAAGQKYDIVIEYYENTGNAVTKLLWSSASTSKAIIPKSQLYPPVIAPATGTGLRGVYYNGINLWGAPLLTRVDTTINFDFSYGNIPQVLSPAPGVVPEDKYSVRWTGWVQPAYSETYTFYTKSDDGIRLWVNGVKLVDDWMNQDATEKSGTISLTGGQKYYIVIEYYENTGNAVTKLWWSSPSTPKAIVPKGRLYPTVAPTPGGYGLQGVYYNGTSLSGAPLLTRIDPTINFDLSYGNIPQVLSPAPGTVPEDMYSVSWTGKVQPLYSETYTFYTVSDDGIRLWVNGVLLVDDWMNQAATEKSGTITLAAGQLYDIKIEYYENTGNAVTKLYWSSASTPKAIIPALQLFPPAPSAAVASARVMDNTNAIALKAAPVALTSYSNISPNPVKPGRLVRLDINSDKTTSAVLQITSSNGQPVSRRTINLVHGVNTISVNTSGLSGGLYIISIAGNNNAHNFKLVVQ